MPIAARSIESLIRTQGIGDFFRIQTLAARDGLELYVTWIPDQVTHELGVQPVEAFDPKFMKALFNYGYQRTLQGDTSSTFSEILQQAKTIPD